MLGLNCSTSDEWIESVNRNPMTVLSDHAHCEKKAALMAISLINRYPAKAHLVQEMAELAQEEMAHFAMVVGKMQERGYRLSYDPGDRYVQLMHESISKQEPRRMLDSLIVASLIEARSCERFKLLSERCEDTDLRTFYASLLESEARHRSQFLGLAREYFSLKDVASRLDELETREAEIVLSLSHQPTMHG